MELEYCNEIISNYKQKFIEKKDEFLGIANLAKESYSLGSLSISEGVHSIGYLPLPIVLTV